MTQLVPRTRAQVALATVFLAGCAALGTSLPVPLFYGVHFVFGSIATVLAAVWLGRLPAALVGFAGGLVTVELWGHGYALLIFTVEGLAVAELYRRGWRNLVFADLAFWLAFGVPVILIGYYGLMSHSWDAAALIALKQPLNGLFNALLAGLILTAVQFIGDDQSRHYMEAREQARILFPVMLLLTLVAGAVPIIYGGYSNLAQNERAVADRLRTHAQDLRARMAEKEGGASEHWQRLLAEQRTNAAMGLALLDAKDRPLVTEGPVREDAETVSKRRTEVKGLEHWAPEGIANPMERWREGRYRVAVNVPGSGPVSSIAVETDAAPVVTRIKEASAQRFGIVGAWFGIALLISYGLTRALLRPIDRLSSLAGATTNGVVITGPDGLTQWVNRAFTNYSGYTLDEMRGRKPGHVLQGSETDAAAVRRIRESLNEEEGFREEILNYANDGTAYWIDITCSPLTDEDGVTTGYMAVQTDITATKQAEQSLERERERLTNILWGTGAGTWEWNVATGEVRFNERWAEIVGYRLEELEPINIDTWLNLTHPDDLESSNKALERHFRGETAAYECEVRMRHRDGHWVWVLDRGCIVSRTADGGPLWMYGTHLDVTQRRQAQERAEELLSRLQKLMAKVPGFVYQYQQWPDGSARFPYASSGVRETYGVEPEDVMATPELLFERVHPEDYSRVLEGIQASFHRLTTWRDSYRITSADGEIRWLEGHSEPEAMADGSVLWHGYIRDITDLRAYQDQLEAVAHYDAVTGLANRNLLSDRLRKAMAAAERHGTLLTVVYLDLDGFKPVNDTYGHEVGDLLLEAIGARLQRDLRATDTAARIGGDEFVVVLTDITRQVDAERTVARILDSIAEPIEVHGHTLGVGASAGVTFYPQREELEPEQLLRQADEAMYGAKRAGKQSYRLYTEVPRNEDS